MAAVETIEKRRERKSEKVLDSNFLGVEILPRLDPSMEALLSDELITYIVGNGWM